MLFAVLLAFAACKKDNRNYTVDYKYNYYPLDSGHYIIYNVDSVTFYYDGINYNRDTVRYQLMALFDDTIHDLLDSVNFTIKYLTRPDENSPWSAPYITYCLRTKTNLQVIENDIRFIKLVYPPSLNLAWNGNLFVPTTGVYSTFLNWNYYYENADTTIQINGQTYNNALVASEVNSVNALTKEVRTEVYAPNVGLIYEEWESLNKYSGTMGNITLGWDTGAGSGFSIHKWAIAHYP